MDSRLKIGILLFVVFVLASLDVAIYLNAKNLDTENCVVDFKSYKSSNRWTPLKTNYSPGMVPAGNFKIKLTDLHDSLKNGKCLIRWDNQEGYIIEN